MSDVLPTLPISLSGLEVVYLSDALHNGAFIRDDQSEIVSIKDLIVKLGGLYRELVSVEGIKGGPLECALSQAEVWLCIARVRTGDLAIDGQTNVGVLLSLKLYELLGRFESHVEESFDSAATDGPPLGVNQREALQALRKAEELNARDQPS